MENRFGLKDFVVLVLLVVIIVMVALKMIQDDRQWEGKNLVAVELGAGSAIPTVRTFCERAAGDRLVRVNPREPPTRRPAVEGGRGRPGETGRQKPPAAVRAAGGIEQKSRSVTPTTQHTQAAQAEQCERTRLGDQGSDFACAERFIVEPEVIDFPHKTLADLQVLIG